MLVQPQESKAAEKFAFLPQWTALGEAGDHGGPAARDVVWGCTLPTGS